MIFEDRILLQTNHKCVDDSYEQFNEMFLNCFMVNKKNSLTNPSSVQ